MKKLDKIILAASIVAIVFLLAFVLTKKSENKADVNETISLIVSDKEKLAELVTFRYSRDTILFETKDPSVLASLFSRKPDTVAVFLARPTICAGIDLRKLTTDDFRMKNDTLLIRLPDPEILDLYLNHSDLTQVYSARNWTFDDSISKMSERAKEGLKRDALRQGILLKAARQAEQSISTFLTTACNIPVVASCDLPRTDTSLPASAAN